MSKRFDNKKLIYLIAGLIVLLVVTMVVRIPKESATLKSRIVEFDTTAASKIIIYPKYLKESQIEFVKSNGKWTVQQGSVISSPQKGAVQNIFGELLSLKPQSLAAVNITKWAEFELTDSLATRVKILNAKGKALADVLLGKFTYKQVSNPYGGYGNNNNVEGTSFVRVTGEKEVYAVSGFVAFSFSGKFNDWRDKTFIGVNKNDITNISFTYPADSSFKLVKKDARWLIGIQSADSIKTSDFLTPLGSLNGDEIKDNFTPVLNPVFQMNIEGNNLLNVTVKGYTGEIAGEYILNSSQNPDVYFSSKKEGLFGKLFKSQGYFLKSIYRREPQRK
jgi:hypothetical protein